MGALSLQVYKAKLRSTGETVAVKVRGSGRPECQWSCWQQAGSSRPVRSVVQVMREVCTSIASTANPLQMGKNMCQQHRSPSTAVQVQRPGIGEQIAVDMVLLRRLVAVVDNNIPQAR